MFVYPSTKYIKSIIYVHGHTFFAKIQAIYIMDILITSQPDEICEHF